MATRHWFPEEYCSMIIHLKRNSKLSFGMGPSKILIWTKSAGYQMYFMTELLQSWNHHKQDYRHLQWLKLHQLSITHSIFIWMVLQRNAFYDHIETYRMSYTKNLRNFANPIKVHASIRSISSSCSCISRLVSSIISRLSLYSNVPSSMASSFLARRRESMATISFALQTNICCSGNKSKTSWY